MNNQKFDELSHLKKMEQLVDVITVLDHIYVDLKTAYKIMDLYLKRKLSREDCPEHNIDAGEYLRLFFNVIILTLHKYIELYKRHKGILNKYNNQEAKQLFKALEKLKINDFRNKYSGHAFDEDTKKPIDHEKLMQYYNHIANEHKSLQAFIMKIHVYDFINDKPITNILDELKSQLEIEFNSLHQTLT